MDGRAVSPGTDAWIPDGHLSYRAGIDGVECSLTYTSWKGEPALQITLTNRGHVPFQPVKAGLRLGIDTYMDTYPEWFGKYFPTLMRNEKTHFTGYLQTPSGHTLGLVCPQPVASWSVEYNLGYQDPAPHWFMGHRIESLNIDLLNALPLPSRNPQDLWCLRQGESRSWTLVLIDIEAPGQFETELSSIADIPMIRMERTGYGAGETAVFDVLGDSPQVIVTDDSGRQMDLAVGKVPGAEGAVRISCPLTETGLYTVKATDGDRQAEGILTVHAPWQWILERAREGAWKYSQKATSHIESWYGFHSAFIAARYFPDKELDAKLTDRFEYLFNLLHDTVSMRPRYYSFRIQNTSGTIGMLVDRYQAHGDIWDLQRASRLADWLISEQQREDGAYVNRNTVYTSVIYIAKSMMELALAEREAAAERHYLSAKRAVDQLVASQGDFETEGEMTFEDGMISCSALQIGMLALLTNAFIIEHPDGSVSGYNCTVSRHGDTLRVTPAEKQITRLHCNLSGPWTVVFPGSDTAQLPAGYLGWLP
ncbi:MAG TPA: hypothetical protein IAB85_07695 [Candidatus Coprenecus merdigallinarum]|nr:hypothetical protein [Candidatus Coprenecus merdigallinarum]